MKRIFSLFIAVMTCLVVTAQTPQAVCYQGVATDQQGRELVSQNIKIRLSILRTSASGTEEWVETHSVTTDGFGLFDLPIGVGTRTGGAQTVFSNIKWGADKYFLKVEMDMAGGSNYVVMGVNQLISVPYALYSDKTGVADSAIAASRSVTSITSNTAIYANTSGRALTAGRADTAQFAWLADSARRAQFAWLSDSSRRAQFSWISDSSRRSAIAYYSYNSANTVYSTRAGRADTAQYAWLADSARRANYAVNAGNALTAGRAITAGRSDTAQFAWLADSARRANYAVNAGNALTAGRAITAGRSDTAQFAWLADSARRANYAVNAGNALTAGRAITAGRSDTAQFAWLADSARRANYAVNAGNALTAGRAITAGRSDTALFAWLADSARRANYAVYAGRSLTSGRSDTAQFAWLADSSRRAATAVLAKRATVADSAVLADHAQLSERATFATQAGFAFVADSSRRAKLAHEAYTALDDRDRDPLNEIQSMTYDTTARTLKLTKPNGQFDLVNFNGTPLGAAGASIDYPYGILGEAVLITANYLVPAGKTLFISAANNPITLIDGKRLNIEPGMPIIPTGTIIASCFCSGILVETKSYAIPVVLDFAAFNFEYEIPMGKSFVIKSGTNDSRDMSFLIDGTNFSFYTGSSASPRLVVIPEGKKMRRGLTNVGLSFMVTGYLLNKAP